MLVFGLISTAFDFLTFYVLLAVFKADEASFRTTWFVISVLTELAVVLILRTHLRSWKSRSSTLLLVSTIVVAAIATALPYSGSVSHALDFVPLPPALLLTGFVVVALYAGATEAAKKWYFIPAMR